MGKFQQLEVETAQRETDLRDTSELSPRVASFPDSRPDTHFQILDWSLE